MVPKLTRWPSSLKYSRIAQVNELFVKEVRGFSTGVGSTAYTARGSRAEGLRGAFEVPAKAALTLFTAGETLLLLLLTEDTLCS